MSEIKMDTDVYEGIVNDIDSKCQEFLGMNDRENYVQPDSDCLLNVVIPDYKVAYESLIEVITGIKVQNKNVVKLMNKVEENYDKKVDEDKSSQLEEESEYSSGSSSGG